VHFHSLAPFQEWQPVPRHEHMAVQSLERASSQGGSRCVSIPLALGAQQAAAGREHRCHDGDWLGYSQGSAPILSLSGAESTDWTMASE
jgi:hypothetical protein